MNGKVCIITGATSGIGKETAFALAALKPTLILVCRDERRGNDVIKEISRMTGNSNLELVIADLSKQAEVRNAANEILKKHPRIDVLINNAGLAVKERALSADGIEMTFAVNHLAYFLLTNLLLERIKSSGTSRIINVSSEAHRSVRLDFENLQGEKSFTGFKAYSISKMCNVLFTYELARKLQGTGVTANAMHPGFLNTAIFREAGGLLKFLVGLTAGKASKGADALVYLATDPSLATVTGKYFSVKKEKPSSPASYDPEAARMLWELSTKLSRLS